MRIGSPSASPTTVAPSPREPRVERNEGQDHDRDDLQAARQPAPAPGKGTRLDLYA